MGEDARKDKEVRCICLWSVPRGWVSVPRSEMYQPVEHSGQRLDCRSCSADRHRESREAGAK